MYLTNLIVESLELNTEIRNISFKKGLNLIVDSGANQKSGNDIGKTTFLRSIDFCLGAASNELFYDRDENKQNEKIKKFLIEQKISFTLNIGYSFKDIDIVLRRWFTGNSSKDGKPEIKQSINGDEEGSRSYNKQLNKIFFKIEDKPTFRELIPKFIREEKNSVGSLLRYLGSFKSHEQYNSMHLALFGLKDTGLLDAKNSIYNKIQESEKKLKTYESDYGKKNTLSSKISIKEIEVDRLVNDRNTLQKKIADISKLETNLDELNKLAKEITSINNEILKNEIDIKNINNNLTRLKKEETDIDMEAIAILYKEVNSYNERMQKDFSDIVSFHNKMIINKINFSKRTLHKKMEKLNKFNKERESLIHNYSLKKESADNELFEDLNKLNDILIKRANELNMVQNAFKTIDKLERAIAEDTQEFNKIYSELEKTQTNIQNNINIFNAYFTEYTKRLYGAEYYIYLGKDISSPFEINTKFNPGDGKKKAVITAFDLAYTAFLDELKLGYPRFIAEDQMELIDVQQLQELFNISNELNCQLIIPVLKSKLHDINGIDQREILTLSEESKFFKF